MNKNVKRVSAVLLSLIMICSFLSLSVFASDECKHTDTNSDGYCDICGICVETAATVYAEKAVTAKFKAGTLLYEDNIKSIILSQSVDAAGFIYKNGEIVKETDTVPYGIEILEIYTIIKYEEEGPTCEKFGHKAYYFNTFDNYYYEDAACTKCIGTEDELRFWLSSLELGATAFPLGHQLTICDDVNKGHICAREGCEYNKTPGYHILSDDETCCAQCGAPCFRGCPHDPTCSDFFDFCNIFKNDGKPLEYATYYVSENVTLTEPLIIKAPYLSLLIADGVTFNAQAGYHFVDGGMLDVFYQSKGDGKGTFVGTEYKCHDEKTGLYYADHIDGDSDFTCDVCGKADCPHNNISCSYKWSDDYSKCAGKAVCDDCKRVLSEEDGTVVFCETSKGNCETKGKGYYAAYFEYYIDYTQTEKIETDFGAHSYNSGSFYCKNCYREDLMGAKMSYNNRIDALETTTDNADALALFSQLRNEINAAESVEDIGNIFEKYYAENEEIFAGLTLADIKVAYKAYLKNIAKNMPSYSKATSAYLSEIEMLVDEASDENELSNIYDDAYDYIRSIEKLKDKYKGEFVQRYYVPSTTDMEKSVILAVIYEISSAVHNEDVEKIYSGADERISLAALVPAKLEAKAAIDSAAGAERSQAMQNIVSQAKSNIDAAKTAEEVETAKQNGLSAIEAQKQAEKPTEPGEKEACPKCGGTHADNFFGKIVCFFNRIGNWFRNLFK